MKYLKYLFLVLICFFVFSSFALAAPTTDTDGSGSSTEGTTTSTSSGTLTCDDLISEELQETIDEYLGIFRIAVPIIIIAMGSVDFFKAVISTDEKEMKKAQSAFIKRLVIGVIILLLPLFIDLIINVANFAWGEGRFGECGVSVYN